MINPPKIAITMGDPNGIGPEIILKVLSKNEIRDICLPVVVGPKAAFDYLEADSSFFNEVFDFPEAISSSSSVPVLNPGGDKSIIPTPGEVSKSGGWVAGNSLECAIKLAQRGDVQAIVTAPISKKALNLAGFAFDGHTEFLAARCNTPDVMMMLKNGDFRVGLVTTHCPVSKIAGQINEKLILKKLRILNRDLQQRFGISQPRIAVTALNPHAGESGLFGSEEIEIITPAVETAKNEGLDVAGPFPADSLFTRIEKQKFDAYLAMYHDQGLIPVKMKSPGRGVNYTAGLPIIRTSPDHGTAFDIAGKGLADSGSMEEAVRFAVELTKVETHHKSQITNKSK